MDPISDIGQRGLQAAGEIVDRLVAAVDGARERLGATPGVDAAGEPAAGNGSTGGGVPGVAELDGLVDLWGELAKGFVHALAGAASGSGLSGVETGTGRDREDGKDGGASAARGGPDRLPLVDDAVTPVDAAGTAPDAIGAANAVSADDAVDLVDQMLGDTGRQVRRAMLDAIPDGEPHRWLYRLVRSYPSRAGKSIRPALCLATCRAFGGTDADALPLAVAIELLHNAFLVHDDIADGSRRRRGRPTLAHEHGVALALNAGDALAVVAHQVLRHHCRGLADDIADRVFEEFETMALRTLEGQATELGWRRDDVDGLTPEDYLGLIMRKTCWYTTIHPLRIGALAGSKGSADVRPMVRFGFYLGAAFQIRDDVLNLVGDEAVYGKEIDGDLYEGKRTLMLIHLMAQAQGGDRATVEAYLRQERDQRTAEGVAEIRRLMDTYGSLDFAVEYAEGIASAALDAFDQAFAAASPGHDTAFVRALVPYMLGRRS